MLTIVYTGRCTHHSLQKRKVICSWPLDWGCWSISDGAGEADIVDDVGLDALVILEEGGSSIVSVDSEK